MDGLGDPSRAAKNRSPVELSTCGGPSVGAGCCESPGPWLAAARLELITLRGLPSGCQREASFPDAAASGRPPTGLV